MWGLKTMKATIKGVDVEGTPAEIEELMRHREAHTYLDIVKALRDKEVQNVPTMRVIKAGKRANNYKQWSGEEDRLLYNMAIAGKSMKEMRSVLGRTKDSIKCRKWSVLHGKIDLKRP
jgi:hypothetical protein